MKHDKDSGVAALINQHVHVAGHLAATSPESDRLRTDEEIQRLSNALEMHQIELENQNAELRQARDEVEKSLKNCIDLFDFAPVGYFNLDRDGTISAVNLTGAELIGVDRSGLICRRFDLFIAKESQPAFRAFLMKVFANWSKETCEIEILRKENVSLTVQLEARTAISRQECRIVAIDITERKQALDALRESEEQLYKLAEMSVDAITMLDGSGVVTFCNAAVERMFDCCAADVVGMDFHQLFTPERLIGAVKNGFEIFRENGAGPLIGRTTEMVALRKNGTEFPLELSVSALKIKGSWHAIAIMRDATERKQLKTEVQDALEYAENIVETVREPLVVLNSDLKILTANHSFYETFRVTPEETIGNFIYDLGNRQWDIPKLRVLFEKILPHDTVFNGYEVEHDFQDIGRKTILLNARQIFREKIGSRIILLAMEDITARKLAEERISEVIRQQQAILDNIPDSAWLKDRNGRYVAVNEPFSRIFGVSPKEMIGKSDYDIYPLERAEKYEKNLMAVMVTGTRTCFEESAVDQDGNIRYLEKTKTPIFNDHGVPIGVIGIAHDITNRKEVEVALRHESTHDALTGLYNRAFFDEELERLAHSRMFPVSIVMADVNNLKVVNDTAGHEAGDDLIRLAARIILGVFRAEDIVARIGGDEFAVLLPETEAPVAEEAVRRIMSCPETVAGQVCIAFGVASAENKDQLAEALRLSDERMYKDKAEQKRCRH